MASPGSKGGRSLVFSSAATSTITRHAMANLHIEFFTISPWLKVGGIIECAIYARHRLLHHRPRIWPRTTIRRSGSATDRAAAGFGGLFPHHGECGDF